ncbi:MAG: cobyric acid synthase, partial [Panacagrimonas sp.]
VLGVLPYLQGLALDAEDAIRRDHHQAIDTTRPTLRVVVPALPRISNHTDFDPLALHPQVDLHWVAPHATPPAADLVILPGSKNVRSDLAHLRAQGWTSYLETHLRYGGRLMGICGGLQMLGLRIADPLGLEGPAGESTGFGWLALDTVLETAKQLRNVHGRLLLPGSEARLRGYEIHAGVSTGAALERPLARLETHLDGAMSDDARVLGTYVHGVFDDPSALHALLRWAGLTDPQPLDLDALREAALDRLADAVEQHLDLPALGHMLELDLAKVTAA